MKELSQNLYFDQECQVRKNIQNIGGGGGCHVTLIHKGSSGHPKFKNRCFRLFKLGQSSTVVGKFLERESQVVKKASYSRAFGDVPRNFEPWLSDEDEHELAPPSPNYHTNGRTFELSTNLMCIATLHGGLSAILGSNS
ncbi:hypothetical protein TNCV_4830791 [Trichonephila clavipes]|nr:hypothetical protein TNCV_4830791 [Trichonephila clavipes]